MASSAMMMCAGLGTRLRPFTNTIPKPLIPVMGVPVTQFAVDSLVQAGIQKIVANVHHHAEQTFRGLRQLDWGQAELVPSDESKELLGSAGGIRKALSDLGPDPFVVVNGDVLCPFDIQGLLARHRQLRQSHGVLLTFTLFPRAPGSGAYPEMICDARGELIEKIGTPQIGKTFFSGAYVAEPEAFAHLPEGRPSDALKEVFLPVIEKKKAGAYFFQAPWYDVGSPRLWWETHLELLASLEKRAWPRSWAERIAGVSERIGPQVWRSKRTSSRDIGGLVHGPAFLDLPQGWKSEIAPQTVLYSPEFSNESVTNGGIGLGQHWLGRDQLLAQR